MTHTTDENSRDTYNSRELSLDIDVMKTAITLIYVPIVITTMSPTFFL